MSSSLIVAASQACRVGASWTRNLISHNAHGAAMSLCILASSHFDNASHSRGGTEGLTTSRIDNMPRNNSEGDVESANKDDGPVMKKPKFKDDLKV